MAADDNANIQNAAGIEHQITTSRAASKSTISRLHQGGKASRQIFPRFRPLGRRALLVCLAVVFLLLSAILVLIQQLAHRHHGLRVSSVSQNVLTYVPTVLMLLLIPFWRRIDHSNKSAAPWIELRKGTANADRSVLLDYISTMQVVTIPKSIRNGHLFVALGVCGILLLKAATIASTGLLVPGDKVTLAQRTAHAHRPYDKVVTQDPYSSEIDPAVSYTTYGIMAAGLAQPFGTSPEAAYPLFELPEVQNTNSTFTIVLDAIFPDVMCEPIENVWVDITVDQQGSAFWIDFMAANCNGSSGLFTYIVDEGSLPTRKVIGGTLYPDCQNFTDGRSNDLGERILVLLADTLYEQSQNGTTRTVTDLVGVVCQTSYATGRVKVSGSSPDFPSNLLVETLPDTNGTRADLNSAVAFSSLVGLALFLGPSILGSVEYNYPYNYLVDTVSETSLQIISRYGNGTEADIFSHGVLSRAAKAAFTHVGVQVFNEWLRPNGTMDVEISVEGNDTVIGVTELSSWFMFGVFLVTVALAFILLVTDARWYTTRGTETIFAMARIASESQSFSALHAEVSGCSAKSTQKYLQSYDFYSAFTGLHGKFAIVALPKRESKVSGRIGKFRRWWNKTKQVLAIFRIKRKKSGGDAQDESVTKWWKQITFSTWFLVLTYGYSVAAVSVLEVLQRISDKNDGIAAISFKSQLGRTALARYLPATCFTALAAMYSCLDFNVLLLRPYHRLRSSVTIDELRRLPPVSQVPAISMWKAVLGWDVAILGSSTAAFVAGLLTIVSSGLYTVENVSIAQSVIFGASSVFNTTWTNSVNGDGTATTLLSLIENLNVSYPQGTYDGLALPNVTMQASDKAIMDTSSVASVQAYAYRPELRCDILGPGDFSVSVGKNNATDFNQNATISGKYLLPNDCLRGGREGNSSVLKFDYAFLMSYEDTEKYVAKLLDLHVGPYSGKYQSHWAITPDMGAVGENNGLTYTDNPPGCPSLVFIYGYLSQGDLSQADASNNYHAVLPVDGPDARSITAQVCYQEISRLNVNLTFRGPDMALDSTSPPVLDESTAQKLPVLSSTNTTAFTYRIQPNLDARLSLFNNTSNAFTDMSSTQLQPGGVVDPFFQGVLFGHVPLPVETMRLAPHSQGDQDRMQKSIHSLYSRYMAQVISANMRVNTADLQVYTDDLSFPGTVLNSPLNYQARIVQHKIPKLILQSMIGYMMLGGLVALWCMRGMRKLIPANSNPCTIWGRMNLWLGSRWCDEGGSVPHDAKQGSPEDTAKSESENESRTEQGGDSVLGMRESNGDGEAGEAVVAEVAEATGEAEVPNDAGSQQQGEGVVPGRRDAAPDRSNPRFRLGWWDLPRENSNGEAPLDDQGRPTLQHRRRYGIDVVDED